ncbi:MAG: ArsR family transcriptional regulator [Clostridia bacterium]
MKIEVIRKPCILYETIELFFKVMNGISFSELKKQLLNKCAGLYGDEYEKYLSDIMYNLDIIQNKLTNYINKSDPRLIYYFKKFDLEKQNILCCLAKVMTLSFFNLSISDFDRHVSYTKDKCKLVLDDKRYSTDSLTSAGLAFTYVERRDASEDLFTQLDSVSCPNEYKWEVFKVLSNIDSSMDELAALIRPVAMKLETEIKAIMPLFEHMYDYWDDYFTNHTMTDFAVNCLHFDDHVFVDIIDNIRVNLLIMPCNQVIIDPVEKYSITGIEQLFMGIIVNPNLKLTRSGVSQDDICNTLHAISDKSRYELLCLLSRSASYGLELSEKMSLNVGTISRNLNMLYDSGLLHMHKVNNRIYYSLNRPAVEDFFTIACKSIVGS